MADRSMIKHMTIIEFLTARLDEQEQSILQMDCSCADYGQRDANCPDFILADIAAKRAIVEWHQNWPVLVERTPVIEPPLTEASISSVVMRVSREFAWATEREYRARFGSEPPTGPILRMLAQPFSEHPDFDPDWRI